MTEHIPYGYRIVDGIAAVDEVRAEQVRILFKEYISGKALEVAAEVAGLKLLHGSVGRLLRNIHYLGDNYYPAIIDRKVFDKAEEERLYRANHLGRIRELKAKEMPAAPVHFTIGHQTKVIDDPFEQAEYTYSLIEREMNLNDNN